MQPIALNDVLQVTLEGSVEQQPWALVRHYRVVDVSDPEVLLQAIADYFKDILCDLTWKEVATTLWSAECVTITRVAPQPMNAFFYSFSPAVVGNISTDGLPGMNAAIGRLTTDAVGASRRGRCYLSGVPEASTNGNVLLASVHDAWEAVVEKLATAIAVTTDEAHPCIFSRTLYNPAAAPPQDVSEYSADITGYQLQGNIATQRRRRAKRSTFSS